MEGPVLVLGATGRQGSAVVDGLLALGHEVRALVRDRDDPGSARLAELDVTTVVGGFDDVDALTAAAEGTSAIFAMTTPAAGVDVEVRHGRNVASAAEAAGTGHLVYSSVASADRTTGIPHFDSKAKVEEYLRGRSVPWTIVGPTWFMDNLLFPWNLEDYATGKLRLALSPERPVQMISSANVGRFCAHVIDRRAEFFGERIEIAADELSGRQMASGLATALGREIAFEELPLEEEAARFEDSATMYAWLERSGFVVDLDTLHEIHAEVDWIDFPAWAAAQSWSAP